MIEIVVFLGILVLLLILKLASGPKIRTIQVKDPWFTGIVDGLTTVHAYPGGIPEFTSIAGTKYIKFQNDNRRMLCTLHNVKQFATLQQYVSAVGWQNCAPHARSEADAIEKHLRLLNSHGRYIFSQQNIDDCGGIIAVVFELV